MQVEKKQILISILKDIKTEVEELKKKLNNKLTDRLEELQITKQLKVLENELRKKENDLFFLILHRLTLIQRIK